MIFPSKLAALSTAASIASIASAATPSGFTPGSTNSLVISYGGVAAADGQTLQKAATQSVPVVGTTQPLTGSHAVVMIDLDIPTNSPPQTNTLLHWMQLDVQSAKTATTVQTSTGQTQQIFALTNATAPAAQYIGPSPPARVPLSHRYTFIVVDTNGASQSAISTLTQAAGTRVGFSASSVLTAAGLESKVVAGGFFIVSNPGPLTNATSNSTSPTFSPTTSPTRSVPGSTSSILPGGAPGAPEMKLSMFGLAVAAAAAMLL